MAAAALAPSHALSIAAVDRAEHTLYVEDNGPGFAGPTTLDLIDTRRCRAGDTAGCHPQPPLPTIPLAGFAGDIVVDQSTNTVYVDGSPTNLEVIDASSCNVTDTSCAKTAFVPLGTNNSGGPIAINPTTHTVYVGGASDIAIVDTRHCNAAHMTGCATQTPVIFPVGIAPNDFGVAPDTLYDAQFNGANPFAPSVVDVIDTRHCQAADTSGCAAQPAAQAHVGISPSDTAVDPSHHTLYVPNNGNGTLAGTISMLDTTHCNGDDTTECGQTAPTTRLPRTPASAILDPSSGTLYVAATNNAAEALIDTSRCNATMLGGCRTQPRKTVVGSGPFYGSLDPANHTLYMPSIYDGAVSLIDTARQDP